jgi:hypothetical protein
MKVVRCDFFLQHSIRFLSRSDKPIFARSVRKFPSVKDPGGPEFITPAACLCSEQG